MKLKLIRKKQETSDVETFVFQPEQPFEWKAGQFLNYTLPHQADDRGVKRFFTIATAPFEEQVHITTRFTMEKGSSFKNSLQKMSVGESIEASGPNGSFVIEDPQQKYVFIAGGIGITPFRAMLLDLSHQDLPLNVTLFYANRNDEIVFKDELDQISVANPDFKIHYIVEPERINAEVIKQNIEGQSDKLYYISGPKPFVEAMEKTLDGLGIPKEQVKTDYFPGYSS